MVFIKNPHDRVDFPSISTSRNHTQEIFISKLAGGELNSENEETFIKLLNNIYKFNDNGVTWLGYITEGLPSLWFEIISNNSCVFTRGTNMIIIYVDD